MQSSLPYIVLIDNRLHLYCSAVRSVLHLLYVSEGNFVATELTFLSPLSIMLKRKNMIIIKWSDDDG